MSELSVAKITTTDDTTPLFFTTGNNQSGFIKVETANDEILFAGTPRFTGAIPVAGEAFDQANTATTIAGEAFDQANTATTIAGEAFDQANTAYDTANTKTSTGKAIAMAIVFGG
jgi:hypothetical protein